MVAIRRLIPALAVPLLAGALALGAAPPADAAPASGSVKLAVSGVAAGQPVKVVLSRKGQKTRTARRKGQVLRGLRAGVWRVRVLPVRTNRRHRAIPAGAKVLPRKATLRVRVRAKRRTSLAVAYGTVVNPRTVVAPRVSAVAGDPALPTSITVPARSAPRRGAIVTSGPTVSLPEGLVARVTGVRAGPAGQKVLTLRHVPVSEAVPVISYRGPLLDQRTRSADLGSYMDLKLDGSSCGIFGGFEVGGGFTFGAAQIEADVDAGNFGIGAKASFVIHSRPRATLNVTTDAGVFCEKELGAPTVIVGYIPAGVPIPVYVSIPLKMRAEANARTIYTSEVSWDMAIGVRTRGVLAVPVFEASNPSMDIRVSSDVVSKAGPSVGVETGLGIRHAASISVKAATALEFTTSGRQCAWDWKPGDFDASVSVGPLTARTPSASLPSHRLWTGCGASTFTPPGTGGGETGPIPGTPRLGIYPQAGKVRPAEVFAGPSNCSPHFYDLTWTEWGPSRAVATGMILNWPFGTAIPGPCFSTDPLTVREPVTLTLSEPKQCEEGYVFSNLAWTSPSSNRSDYRAC